MIALDRLEKQATSPWGGEFLPPLPPYTRGAVSWVPKRDLTLVAPIRKWRGPKLARTPVPAAFAELPNAGPVRRIQAIVAEVWGIPVEAMTSPRRKREWAWPRQAAMALCIRLVPEASLPKIGRQFGKRDHTTVMHAVRAVAARTDEKFLALYREAERRVCSNG